MNESLEETIQTIKCMIVGDSAIGKTHLFKKLTNQSFPSQYEPTVFDVFNMEVTTKNSTLNLNMWDSAGGKVYDNIRPISYPHTDCFIVCYAVNERSSFENVCSRWLPEIAQHGDGPSVPIILVTTKYDLKTQDLDKEYDFIQEYEEKQLQSNCGAKAHFTWSSDSQLEDTSAMILKTAVELAYLKIELETKPADPIWRFASPTIIFFGDTGVGKSSLMQACFCNNLEGEKVKERYHNVVIKGCEYFLKLISTSCANELLQYIQNKEQVDLLVACYAINDPFSFKTIESLFQNSHSEKLKQIPVILIGTKLDLKQTSSCAIPFIDGKFLSEKISSVYFAESSIISSDCISSVIDAIFENIT